MPPRLVGEQQGLEKLVIPAEGWSSVYRVTLHIGLSSNSHCSFQVATSDEKALSEEGITSLAPQSGQDVHELSHAGRVPLCTVLLQSGIRNLSLFSLLGETHFHKGRDVFTRNTQRPSSDRQGSSRLQENKEYQQTRAVCT